MTTPRLSVRTSPPWEGLGRLPYYCSRRDAADEMPLKALVLIFVSLPLSPILVLGASFLLLLVLFAVCCTITKKKFYCVCCHFLGFRKYVVRQQVIRLKGVTGVTANLKWILKCFLGKFLFDAFMRQLLEYAAERDALKEDVEHEHMMCGWLTQGVRMVSTTCDDAWHKENNAWKACRLWVLWSIKHKSEGSREISVRLTIGR